MRVSDADRNGTLRRLHNAVALGLIDIDEFEERSALVSQARLHSDLDALVGDLPGPGAIVTSATDRVELRGVLGSLKRQGEWIVPTRLALHRRMGSVDLDLTRARFAGPMVVIELDMKFGGLDLRLPDGASASIDDVEVIVGSAHDHRKDAPPRARRTSFSPARWCADRWTSAGPARAGGSAALLERFVGHAEPLLIAAHLFAHRVRHPDRCPPTCIVRRRRRRDGRPDSRASSARRPGSSSRPSAAYRPPDGGEGIAR